MSIRSLFPTDQPSLVLDFANSRRLDPRITFTRVQTGNVSSYMGPDGLIKYAGQDQPRFDHRYNSATGEIESLGLLIEETRTNIASYSTDFSNNAWIKQNDHPYTSNATIAPDGTNTATRFSRTANNQYIWIGPNNGAGTFTLSAWVKSVNPTGQFAMQSYSPTDGGLATNFTATNTWQRFSRTVTVTVPSGFYPCIALTPGEDFFVWGVQVEAGASQTSYIPTSGSSVTRNIDKAFIPDCSIYPWYNASEGSVVFEHNGVTPITTSLNFPAWGFAETNTGKSGFCKQIFFVRNDLTQYFLVRDGIANDQVVQQVSGGATSRATHSFGYKENNFAAYYAGNQYAAPDYSGTSPVNSHSLNLAINDWSSGGGDSSTTSSTTRRFLYYPTRISDSHLQQLTKD